MKFYSDYPRRALRQALYDLLTLLHIGLWVWLGYSIFSLIDQLRTYGERMETAGSQFRQTMAGIGDDLGSVWLIGDGIRIPFDQASRAGGTLEAAGVAQQDLVHQLALWVGIGIAVVPILTILLLWALPRLRFAIRAGNARRLLRSEHAMDLLALRALATRRLPQLAKIDPDPVGAWRRGDPVVTRQLATLELRAAGVRPKDDGPPPPADRPQLSA